MNWMNWIQSSQIEWFIIITILKLDLFLRNNKKSLTRFRINWKFIFLCSKLRDIWILSNYVLICDFWVFTFIKMFIFHIVSLFYLIQDLSENLICYMIEDKRHVSDIIFFDSFYFTPDSCIFVKINNKKKCKSKGVKILWN